MNGLVVILLVIAVLGPLVALAVGYILKARVIKGSLLVAEEAANQHIKRAEARGKEILIEAKENALHVKQENDRELRNSRKELQKFERQLAGREGELNRRNGKLNNQEQGVKQRMGEIESLRKGVEELRLGEIEQLEKISSFTADEARQILMEKTMEDARFEFAKKYRSIEEETRFTAEEKARSIVAEAIQRLAVDVVSERSVNTVPLPDEDMKGRLIGKEGRNIRSIEAAMGVDLIIDDAPQSVTVSCFDPVRREVARLALENLVKDGRIQPARIEEMVARYRKKIDEVIRKAGADALIEVGIKSLHPSLVEIAGRLKYRYSYGENVLRHSIEVGLLAGMMASELGAKVRVCKVAGFLHDIGKAVTHEVDGPHAEIGADMAEKYGLPEDIVRPIREHHDAELTSVESFIVAAADAVSAARPGARRDTLERYTERLQALENAAKSFKGVDRCFAIQAGREVRVMVNPNGVDDAMTTTLARDIAKRIEDTLTYPGQVKVVVIRESRAVHVAS